MIKGFEQQTHELTDDEQAMVAPIVSGLRTKINKENAITNGEMCRSMRAHGYKITPVRMRKIIHHIRVNGLVKCLVSTSKGYYITGDIREGADYVKSLEQRIASIEQVRQALADQFGEYYAPPLFKK